MMADARRIATIIVSLIALALAFGTAACGGKKHDAKHPHHVKKPDEKKHDGGNKPAEAHKQPAKHDQKHDAGPAASGGHPTSAADAGSAPAEVFNP